MDRVFLIKGDESVAKNNPDKKSMGWFKGVLSNQNEPNHISTDEENYEPEAVEELGDEGSQVGKQASCSGRFVGGPSEVTDPW